jgi:hypothetical protein
MKFEAEKYTIWFVEDGDGNRSHHWAETKDRAIQAHLTHWGMQGTNRIPRAISIQSHNGLVCKEPACVTAADIPPHAAIQLK